MDDRIHSRGRQRKPPIPTGHAAAPLALANNHKDEASLPAN
jgi:hypothetical protein